jgi:hypothetical protein
MAANAADPGHVLPIPADRRPTLLADLGHVGAIRADGGAALAACFAGRLAGELVGCAFGMRGLAAPA